MIDEDWEEIAPLDPEHEQLWCLGYGPAKREKILDTLHDIQRDQCAAGLSIMGIHTLCRFLMWTPERSLR